MYQEDYENDRPENTDNRMNQDAGQPEKTIEPERETSGNDRSMQGETDGRYGSSQPGMSGNYGSSQPGMSGNYGSSQSGTDSSYGNSRSGGLYGRYGSNQPGTNGSYGNGQYGANSNYGGHQPGPHYAPWQRPQQAHGFSGQEAGRRKSSHPILKKTAGITAAALLFGVVAGGTMVGINRVSQLFQNSGREAAVESTIAQAETLPRPAQPETAAGSGITAVPAITNDVSAIVEKAMPSVVAINSVTEYQTRDWFGIPQVYEGRGSGSGIIVGESEEELLIVTNNHVVNGAKTLGVVFVDNEVVEANVKGTDSANDLAVIAVDASQIPQETKDKIAVATLGNSDSLKVGQGVIAIGNALGYGQSVTVGYVSALDREVQTEQQTTRNLLQTDAAINPGNSGGALLNMQGEVVGINSAKYSSTEVEGMGYAIPISKVQDIIDNLMTKKTRIQVENGKQGYLGIQAQNIDSQASVLYGMPQGVFVYKILEDGAAAASDLKEKDIITKFDGQSIQTKEELTEMLSYYAGGDTVELTVQSLVDGQYVERQVQVTLGVRQAEEVEEQ